MSSIGLVVSEEKMFENVDGRRTDGRRSHWYTISSPMSLRLRWAKNSANGKKIMKKSPSMQRVKSLNPLENTMKNQQKFHGHVNHPLKRVAINYFTVITEIILASIKHLQQVKSQSKWPPQQYLTNRKPYWYINTKQASLNLTNGNPYWRTLEMHHLLKC